MLALYLTDLKNWDTKMSSISSNHSVRPHLKVRLTSETLVSLRHVAAFLLTEYLPHEELLLTTNISNTWSDN